VPSTCSRKFRRNASLPGILEETVELRLAEFSYEAFSPYALELICFDLRKRREHVITRAFADDTEAVQDALDRELVSQYRPGKDGHGLLLQALSRDVAETRRPRPSQILSNFQRKIQCPELLDPCIEQRWQELGYRDFSAYVTGLVRFDLLLLGPHYDFSGHDKAPDILAALDAETFRIFQANQPQRMFLDSLIETAVGFALTDEERAGIMRGIARKIRAMILKAGGAVTT
jgi:hypothetical protein